MTVNDALCSMTGYAREGLLGEHVSTILMEEGADAWDDAVESLTGAGGESRSLELAIETKDGRVVPCENNVGLLPSDEQGEPRGTVGVLRDITERKERERELRLQNERLDAFASIISHDLRNPLSVARGYLDVVAESATDDEAIGRVEEALTRMNEMIGDVLALARGGEEITDPEPVVLSSIVESAWANVDHAEASLEVETDLKIRADGSRLLRLFENLFRNAIQHGGADVTVRVGTIDVATPDCVGFFVEDDGPGMPPDVREKAFQSEFTTSEDGHGIGLWVVSEVADAHGWKPVAAVGSEGGARFEFSGVERVE
jgi:PAS domain S-box-containing protein